MTTLGVAPGSSLNEQWRREPGAIAVLTRGHADDLHAIVEGVALAQQAGARLVALAALEVPPLMCVGVLAGGSPPWMLLRRDRIAALRAALSLAASGVESELVDVHCAGVRQVVELCTSRGASHLVISGRRAPGARALRRLTSAGLRVTIV